MITIMIGDITKVDADVIVNAANTRLAGGGGVDGAIHRSAGPSVLRECRKIGGCRTGKAVMTNAGSLKARWIIHTAGPVWRGGGHGEPELLRSCYRESFKLARKNGCRRIAFPAISTGVYGYPMAAAAKIALETGRECEKDFDEIVYVSFSKSGYDVYKKIWEEIG